VGAVLRVQPRQQLLEIWQAVIAYSYRDGAWHWGGRDGRNSISDAEQLLCILGPATTISPFSLDVPDRVTDDVLAAMKPLGGVIDIPLRLLRAVGDYLRTYTDEANTPIFSSESYFRYNDKGEGLTDLQRSQPVVDSFAISLSLSLATIGFVREFRKSIRRRSVLDELDELEAMASRRLTAAMAGLLRSFAVNIFGLDSRDGRALARTVNQGGLPDRRIVSLLHEHLRPIRAALRDVTIGSGAGLAEDVDLPDRLFECGWSWGVVRDAPAIVTREDIGEQPIGLAEPAPYIYFTVVALDAIALLFTERTRELGLLNEEQQRLSQGLQLRWGLTQSYWSKVAVADFGGPVWPLEDIPWQRTTEKESDYFSLHVSSIVVQDLVRRRAADAELDRVGRVLEELAARARITRRVYGGDDAYMLHAPGFPIDLGGSDEDGGPTLMWIMSDFAPLLLKRTISLAGLLRDPELRGRMLTLTDRIWTHLKQRRLRTDDPRGLWDQPNLAFPDFDHKYEEPSWYHTKRVIDGLITASEVINSPPLRSTVLGELAVDMITEADHLFDKELLEGSTNGGSSKRTELQELRTKLDRARTIMDRRPATALALLAEILRRLDSFAAARDDLDGQF
jgi:hypothetical protein